MSWTSVRSEFSLNKSQNVVFYVDVDGIINVVDELHANMFVVLEKLGLKLVPSKIMSVLTTATMTPGTYNLTYITKGSGGVTSVANPQLVLTAHQWPSIDVHAELADCKQYHKKKGPSREDKKRWQSANHKHSRNTGRAAGRR